VAGAGAATAISQGATAPTPAATAIAATRVSRRRPAGAAHRRTRRPGAAGAGPESVTSVPITPAR
jgi:hypothetical protein